MNAAMHTLARSLFVALVALSGCAASTPSHDTTVATEAPKRDDEAAIRAAIAAPHRSEANRKRDAFRHPAETLSFFGLKTDMTVLELWPGNGWYTEILAPLLVEHGKLIVTSVDPNGPEDKPATKSAHDLQERFHASPEVFGKVQTARINPPDHFDLGPDASVDLVVTFRSIHDWVRDGYTEKVLAAIFKVLKPGGTLGLVAHRFEQADPAVVGKTGYLSEAFVIELARKAGFTLAARSDVNANPKDTHDHPEGVWTLPPTLRLGDQDREKYAAIGETDRMTLRFSKPR